MAGFLAALKSELESLRGELARDPRYRRITKLEQLLADYTTHPIQVGGTTVHVQTRDDPPADSKEAKAKREVLLLLATGPQPRTKLLEVLLAKKIMGHEKFPIKALAKFLGRWPEVKSDGKGSWTLA